MEQIRELKTMLCLIGNRELNYKVGEKKLERLKKACRDLTYSEVEERFHQRHKELNEWLKNYYCSFFNCDQDEWLSNVQITMFGSHLMLYFWGNTYDTVYKFVKGIKTLNKELYDDLSTHWGGSCKTKNGIANRVSHYESDPFKGCYRSYYYISF